MNKKFQVLAKDPVQLMGSPDQRAMEQAVRIDETALAAGMPVAQRASGTRPDCRDPRSKQESVIPSDHPMPAPKIPPRGCTLSDLHDASWEIVASVFITTPLADDRPALEILP